MFTEDGNIVVYPQPPVFDGECERSLDESDAEFENDPLVKASSRGSKLDLRKERNFSPDSNSEGLFCDVNLKDDL